MGFVSTQVIYGVQPRVHLYFASNRFILYPCKHVYNFHFMNTKFGIYQNMVKSILFIMCNNDNMYFIIYLYILRLKLVLEL